MPDVSLHLAGQVATVRLEREAVRNALSLTTWTALLSALENLDANPEVRAVVLTGGDKFFSSGGDVTSMPGSDGDLLSPVERLTAAHRVIRRISTMGIPVVAAVERYAIGAAWGLALACDLVVAGENAYFQAPFSRRGLVADTGVGWHLTDRLGHQHAARYLLLAERMSAATALGYGLVSHLTPDGSATVEAGKLAAQLCDGPRESNSLTKSLYRSAHELTLDKYLDSERICFALAAHGRDAKEGIAAFKDKREPNFK